MTSVWDISRNVAALALGLLMTGSVGAAELDQIDPLVSVDWLAEHAEADNLVILDLRQMAGEGGYHTGRIPNALHAPYPGVWRTDRGDIVGVLPDVDTMEAYVEQLGISNDSVIVIVPAGNGSTEFGSSARVYWTLSYLGLEHIGILDGGLKAWKAAGLPITTEEPMWFAGEFQVRLNEDLLASTADVEARIDRGQSVLLDARTPEQFLGKVKHEFAKAFGHLPGAVNLDQSLFYDEDKQRLKSLDQLKASVPAKIGADSEVEIVSYCNTGHWAATNWFVLHELLGFTNTTLYDESMVGWTQSAGRPLTL